MACEISKRISGEERWAVRVFEKLRTLKLVSIWLSQERGTKIPGWDWRSAWLGLACFNTVDVTRPKNLEFRLGRLKFHKILSLLKILSTDHQKPPGKWKYLNLELTSLWFEGNEKKNLQLVMDSRTFPPT